VPTTARRSAAEVVAAQLLDGRAAAEAIRAEVAAGVQAFTAAQGHPPGLATLLAGDDPGSAWYVRSIGRAARAAGMQWRDVRLDTAGGDTALRATIGELNADRLVHGVIVLLPLPAPLSLGVVAEGLDPAKDVDGITTASAGRLALGEPGLRPATPLGGVELLKRNNIPLVGAEAVVLGRSNIVGKPLALLLLAEHATVTLCHTRTRDLAAVCRRADILCAAVGRPGLVTADMVNPGAVVLDFGTTPNAAGKLVGDVDVEPVRQVAGWISPVPGGTESVTTAILLRNTLEAAQRQASALSC
jgi:methylenetetrahydrofolate dehydrogenase (NADP+) / methenyltetrahydrofolate cyclohydrolase